MSIQVEPISYETHRDLRVKTGYTFDHMQHEQFSPLSASEFSYASTCFPIFFIKDKNTGRFFAVALFGFKKGENLFYSSEQWQAAYVPQLMGIAPFSMAPVAASDDEKRWVACIDRNSSYLSSEKGEALFDGDTETDYLVKIRERLISLYQDRITSFQLIDRLVELQLVKAVKFRLGFENGEHSLVDGLYTIDGAKLEELSSNVVQEFHERGYFSAIYSMLNSRHNLYDLIRLRKAVGDDPISNLQMVDAN